MATKLPKEGDTVYIVEIVTFAIKEATVKSVPSEMIWVAGKYGNVAVGIDRWALTKPEARDKALKLATNRKTVLTESLKQLDATIASLKGK